MDLSEFPVYVDLGNKWNGRNPINFYLVKHRRGPQFESDSIWKIVTEEMLDSGTNSAIAIFEIPGSFKTGKPEGKATPIWPVGDYQEFAISPPENYCPSRFKIRDQLTGNLESPCSGGLPFCKFTGFGGFSCCERHNGGRCGLTECDAAAGQVPHPNANRCICMPGYVSNGKTGNSLECMFEKSRKVEARKFPEYDPEYEYDQFPVSDRFQYPRDDTGLNRFEPNYSARPGKFDFDVPAVWAF